jgi:hypothetical protein
MYSKWQHNKDLTCRSSLLPPAPPPFGSPPGAQVYLSQVNFHILSVDIKIFSINNTFYVIQLLHSPAGHDGGSSSLQNEPTREVAAATSTNHVSATRELLHGD